MTQRWPGQLYLALTRTALNLTTCRPRQQLALTAESTRSANIFANSQSLHNRLVI